MKVDIPKRWESQKFRLGMVALSRLLKEDQLFTKYFERLGSGTSPDLALDWLTKKTGWSRATFFRKKKSFESRYFAE